MDNLLQTWRDAGLNGESNQLYNDFQEFLKKGKKCTAATLRRLFFKREKITPRGA